MDYFIYLHQFIISSHHFISSLHSVLCWMLVCSVLLRQVLNSSFYLNCSMVLVDSILLRQKFAYDFFSSPVRLFNVSVTPACRVKGSNFSLPSVKCSCIPSCSGKHFNFSLLLMFPLPHCDGDEHRGHVQKKPPTVPVPSSHRLTDSLSSFPSRRELRALPVPCEGAAPPPASRGKVTPVLCYEADVRRGRKEAAVN